MDESLKQKVAPIRNKRHAQPRGLKEGAAWVGTLDWQTSDFDFRRLVQAILESLELSYRSEFGVRVDQLAHQDEIYASARHAVLWYQHADARYRIVDIYTYLHSDLDRLVRKRAHRMVDGRGRMVAD
jgi:hypothetical protein